MWTALAFGGRPFCTRGVLAGIHAPPVSAPRRDCSVVSRGRCRLAGDRSGLTQRHGERREIALMMAAVTRTETMCAAPSERSL